MRNSNLELLRILCMLFIVLGHISGKHRGGLNFSSFDYWVDFAVMPFVCVAVNSFVLISGYWGIKFKMERLLKLNLQTWFYSVLIFWVTFILGWHSFSLTKDLGVFIPIFSKQYWFITAYVALYLLSPILNFFSTSLSKNNFKVFLGIGFILFYVWPTGSFLINTGQLVDDAGYGIVNFSYLYLLGRYIRLYYIGKQEKKYYLLGYFCCSTLCFLGQLSLSWGLGFEFTSWYSYNTIFIWGGSVCLFLYFSRLNVQSTLINDLAKSCLAVYLIHMGPGLWTRLCHELNLIEYSGGEYVFLLILSPVLIYLLCAIIDRIRIFLFKALENYVVSRVCKMKILMKVQTLMDHLNFKNNE